MASAQAPKPMRILLVEDDTVLRDVMVRSLADAGHRIDVATNVEDADHLWRVQPFDAVLLDLNLPATGSATSGLSSGLHALRQARGRGDRTPVLALTARNRTEERIAGLDAGADDYLGKPFEVDELIARIRALVRRARGRQGNPRLLVGNLLLDPATGDVQRGRRKLALTQREFALLELFMRNAGKVLTRPEIADEVWGGPPPSETTNIVDVYVNYLRRKLDAEGEETMLHTVRGAGYVLKAPASRPRRNQKKEGGNAPPSRSSRR